LRTADVSGSIENVVIPMYVHCYFRQFDVMKKRIFNISLAMVSLAPCKQPNHFKPTTTMAPAPDASIFPLLLTPMNL